MQGSLECFSRLQALTVPRLSVRAFMYGSSYLVKEVICGFRAKGELWEQLVVEVGKSTNGV